MTHVTVLAPNALTRALIANVLSDLPGLQLTAWDGEADPSAATPDLLILHDDDPPGSTWLDRHLLAAVRCWPKARIIVLTAGGAEQRERCRSCGVRACLSTAIGVDRMFAVIGIVEAGYIVYPAEVLVDRAVGASDQMIQIPIRPNGGAIVTLR